MLPTQIMPVHLPGRALDIKDPTYSNPAIPVGEKARAVQRQLSVPTSGSQTWRIFSTPANHGDGFMIDHNVGRFASPGYVGRVLDVVWAEKNDGAAIQVHDPHFGSNQRWDIWVSEPFS